MRRILTISLALLFIFLTSCNRADKDAVTADSLSFEDFYSSPQIIIASFYEIKQIKNALNSMNATEFSEYMEESFDEFVMNGMYDYESTKTLLEELESTTVLLLKEENRDINKFSFYHERNEVHVFSSLSDSNRMACYAFTPQNETNSKRDMSKNENLVFEKEIIKNDVAVKIYSSLYPDRGFHAEAKIDGTYISFWVNEKQSVEDFEADFARLEFVKISDLLNEINVSDSQEQISELSSTVTTETASLPEETETAA